MWPTGKSLPPLAQLTSREESCCIVQLVTFTVSNCPQASLNGTQTTIEGKLISEQVANEDDAIQTHYFVGDQVRKAIEAIGGPMPENLPSAPSIRKLVEERRRATKKRRVKAEKQGEQQSLLDSQDESDTGGG